MASDAISDPVAGPREGVARLRLGPEDTAQSSRRALTISAGPDYVEISCGGSIDRRADARPEVAYAVCADEDIDGERLTGTDGAARELREAVQRVAAIGLGIRELIDPRHPARWIDHVSEPRDTVASFARRWRPDRLLAWDAWRPARLHPDHRAAGMAAAGALLAASSPRLALERIGQALTAHHVGEVYRFGRRQPDSRVSVPATTERTLAARAAYQSQLTPMRDPLEPMRACYRDHGHARGRGYAMAFDVLRPFRDIGY